MQSAMISTGPKRIVLASALGLAFGYSSIGIISFGIFVLPLSKEFGWGRGDMSLALTLMSIAIVVLSPLAGSLLDRYGVRRVLIPSILCFGLAFSSLSLMTDSLLHYYAMYLLIALAGVCTTPASYSRVIVAWFDQHRGLALGIALAGIGAGTAIIPLFVELLTANFGWRYAFLGMSGLVLLISLPAVWAWLDDPVTDLPQGVVGEEVGFSFNESIATPQFACIAVSFLLLGIMSGGILAHLVPLLTDRGVTPAMAASVASLLGVTLIIARLFTGYLLDFFFAPTVVTIFLSFPVIGFFVLILGAAGAPAVIAVILIGLGIGAEMDFMSYLLSRYFGLRAFSKLYGMIYASLTIGLSIGPIVMGYSQQLGGNYDFGLKVLLVSSAVAIVPLLFLGGYPQLPRVKVT
ncbi:MAG: MFS family permease [Halioglobus sp.]|jgi:MFS family permease